MVRTSISSATRPVTEMQSDIRCARVALTSTTQQRRQHDDQQQPESSRQGHQTTGVDGKSLTEWLGANAAKAKHSA
ncbi:MAG: hypothetical protein ACREPZ_11060, partial [Rhodanobacteraceae bacterium]